MDETKIYNKLLEHDEQIQDIRNTLMDMPSRTEMNEKLDKIIHLVERLDQEKTVTNYRLDEHDTRITKLEQHSAAA